MLVLSSELLQTICDLRPIHYEKPCPFQLHFDSSARNVETTNFVANWRLLIAIFARLPKKSVYEYISFRQELQWVVEMGKVSFSSNSMEITLCRKDHREYDYFFYSKTMASIHAFI